MRLTGTWQVFDRRHPKVTEVNTAALPVLFTNLAVEDQRLRNLVTSMTKDAQAAAKAPSEQEADKMWDHLEREMSDVIDSLGQQLRRFS